MGEYEPDDSRVVTNIAAEAPGEPPRTGPREDAARDRANASKADDPAKEAHAHGEPGDSTARDATGQKQEGFADMDPDEQAKLRREADSSLP